MSSNREDVYVYSSKFKKPINIVKLSERFSNKLKDEQIRREMVEKSEPNGLLR